MNSDRIWVVSIYNHGGIREANLPWDAASILLFAAEDMPDSFLSQCRNE